MNEEDNRGLPRIGDIITTEQALELCRHFNLDYLVRRIEASPQSYKEWKFDGCSCLPDEVLGLFTGCDWEDITYKCCLPHDLGYAYGEPGNETERKQVDDTFYDNLIVKAGMKQWCASSFLLAVRLGGHSVFGLPFSWSFAQR